MSRRRRSYPLLFRTPEYLLFETIHQILYILTPPKILPDLLQRIANLLHLQRRIRNLPDFLTIPHIRPNFFKFHFEHINFGVFGRQLQLGLLALLNQQNMVFL